MVGSIHITHKKDIDLLGKVRRGQSGISRKREKLPLNERIDVDESGVESRLVREYGRAVRCVTIEDIKRGRKFQRTNLVAAQFKSEEGKMKVIELFCYRQNTTGEIFEDWFKRKLVKLVPKDATIIMDNASFHRKKKLWNLWREGIV
jgi:hypothetical protein